MPARRVGGVDDLAAGVESMPSLLVSIGAPRLRSIGLPTPKMFVRPEHACMSCSLAPTPTARYNALIRRLVSFERAAECEIARLGGTPRAT